VVGVVTVGTVGAVVGVELHAAIAIIVASANTAARRFIMGSSSVIRGSRLSYH
jgi:hypothetical protein